MSERPRRVGTNIDYKILNKTGEKVEKDNFSVEIDTIVENFENLSLMEAKKLRNEGEKLRLKLIRTLDEYDLELLDEVEEIENGLSEIKRIIEDYEEVIVKSKAELGEDYDDTNSKEQVKHASAWIKNAKSELRKKRVLELQKDEERKEEIYQQEKNKLLNEEKHLRLRIDQEIENIGLVKNNFVEDLENNIKTITIFTRIFGINNKNRKPWC